VDDHVTARRFIFRHFIHASPFRTTAKRAALGTSFRSQGRFRPVMKSLDIKKRIRPAAVHSLIRRADPDAPDAR